MTGEKQTAQKQKTIIARKFKDSVFTHLFRQPEYTLQLYQALHPEDTETTISDIHDVTHENILVKDIYNDLGFCVKDKLIILVESQSSWSVNIVIRAFLYLSRTYEDYLAKHKLNVYGTKQINIPEPELYVVYTKPRKSEPEIISLQDDFFGGNKTAVDIKVKVLFGDDRENIIGQYVSFCKILDEQVAIYGYTKEATEEAIRICHEQDILTEYLKNFKLEVIEMTDYLFNEDIISEAYEKSIRDEGRAEGISIGERRGLAKGRNEGIAIGERQAAARYEDELRTLRAQVSRLQAAGQARQFQL